jgi:hypothetical protein
VNVTKRTVASAAVVLEKGTPDLQKAVDNGAIAASVAAPGASAPRGPNSSAVYLMIVGYARVSARRIASLTRNAWMNRAARLERTIGAADERPIGVR